MASIKEIGRLEIGKVRLGKRRKEKKPPTTILVFFPLFGTIYFCWKLDQQFHKGAYMTFHRDDSKPESDVQRHFSLTVCEGGLDDVALQVPKHWHKHHDEYMACMEGSIRVSLDDETINTRPGDPVLFIPRRHVHGFEFPKGKRAVLKEFTQPTGEFKQRFFEDIFADAGFWGVMRGFVDGDTYIALPGPWRWVDEVYMFVLGLLVRVWRPREGRVPASVAPLVADESRKEL